MAVRTSARRPALSKGDAVVDSSSSMEIVDQVKAQKDIRNCLQYALGPLVLCPRSAARVGQGGNREAPLLVVLLKNGLKISSLKGPDVKPVRH